MKFALVIYLGSIWHGIGATGISTIEGFSSLEKCQEAAQSVRDQLGKNVSSIFCVGVK